MIIGIISDVHSNVAALEEVLKENPDVQQWVCLGDFIGLLPLVNETIDLLREKNVICIQGDHEAGLVNNVELKQSFSANEALALQRKVVPKEKKAWIAALTAEKTLNLDGTTIHLIHNITGSSEEKKYTFDLQKLEQQYIDADIVFFGHTHLPFYAEGKQTVFLNPGSLGFPVSKTKMGSYAILDTKTLQSKFYWTPIHGEECINILEKHDYPIRIIELIKERTV